MYFIYLYCRFIVTITPFRRSAIEINEPNARMLVFVYLQWPTGFEIIRHTSTINFDKRDNETGI